MNDDEQPLRNLGNAIYSELIAAQHRYNRVATGKTINAIELHVEPERMYITGPSYLVNLERGRNKTGVSPDVRYGGRGFKETLRLWMQARGIDEGKIPKSGGFGPILWAIYTNINKKGFPGSPGILSKPLSDAAINKAMDDNLGPLANLFAKKVIDLLN